MLNILYVIMLSVIMLSVIMLIIVVAESHYSEWHYADGIMLSATPDMALWGQIRTSLQMKSGLDYYTRTSVTIKNCKTLLQYLI
jgi:hypothetical protein